jgi:pimeloyl-ACP methyl ester carboxylesterase
VVVVEWSLTGFRKMPFACSYVPGASNLRIRLPIYGAVFLAAVDIGTRAERSAFESAGRTALLGAILLAAVFQARRRWRKFASGPFEQIQFDERPITDVAPLDLSHDGVYGRYYRYLDVIPARLEPTFSQRVFRFVRKAALVTACFCAAGFAYERISEWRRPVPPRQGQSVDIGGRSLNYSCIGSGSPTLIFENGGGGAGMEWTPFQREVAKYTQACWYDRAGHGWSDPAPFPHPASAISEDLHRLLAAAAIAPPYVLAGVSFGGVCVRVFAQHYPAEVSGMVLIDSSHIDEEDRIQPPGDGFLPYFPRLIPTLAQVLRPIGILRLLLANNQLTAFEPRTFAESTKEMFYESLVEARAVRSLGDIPLIVLTAGRHRVNPPENPIEARQQRAWEKKWIEAQKQLARLSTHSQQRVFPEAGHDLTRDRPRDVLDAIHEVVAQARRKPNPVRN